MLVTARKIEQAVEALNTGRPLPRRQRWRLRRVAGLVIEQDHLGAVYVRSPGARRSAVLRATDLYALRDVITRALITQPPMVRP